MPGLFADTAPLSAGDKPVVAAPVPPAEAKPPTPPPADAKPFDSKAGAKRLMDLLSTPVDEQGITKPEEKKPEEVKAPVVPAKAEDKPIKVKKKVEPVEAPPPVPKASDLKKPVVPAAEPAAPPAPDDAATFEKGLHEEERALLDDARDAEKYLGDKYKGHTAKMTKFLKDAAAKEKDVEKGDLTEDEYRTWYEKERPKIGALDSRTMERARVKEEVKKDFEPQLADERHARWADLETPKVEARATEVRAKIWESAVPEEILAAATERTKGITDPAEKTRVINEVTKEFALELEIANNITDAARDDIQEFHRITTVNPATGKGLKPLHPQAEVFDPVKGEWVPNFNAADPEARKHAGLLAMVGEVCQNFKDTGGAALKKDGKWFATRKEWAAMAPEQRVQFWTFSNDEIVGRAQANVKNVVQSAIKQQHDRLAALGFKRPGAAAPALPAKPAAPGAPAAPRIAPPPSPADSTLSPTQVQARALAKQLEAPSPEV